MLQRTANCHRFFKTIFARNPTGNEAKVDFDSEASLEKG